MQVSFDKLPTVAANFGFCCLAEHPAMLTNIDGSFRVASNDVCTYSMMFVHIQCMLTAFESTLQTAAVHFC